MYIPRLFNEPDLAKLHSFIEENSFALLVSQGHERLIASHLPILLDRSHGPHGRLFGHMARANSQWQEARGEVLAVFSGPHAYISPAWYEAEGVVPTWNYVAVHAYGKLELVEARANLLEILRKSVTFFESARTSPWNFDEADSALSKLLPTIVGFQITITRIEGKWKLGQNRPEEQRQSVIRVLEGRRDEDSQEIARLMSERRSGAEQP
ncbi:MAG TPA: FMN-binding negative transcriptional regulator [Isosphaeraceae bacterium]|nr:FMN-binding negative transcriptional regulator [Isosphaeraceae bacterium]